MQRLRRLPGAYWARWSLCDKSAGRTRNWAPAFAGEQPDCAGRPGGRSPGVDHAVIIVDPLIVAAIEGGLLAGGEARPLLQFLPVEIDRIAALARIIFEHVPGDRIIFAAEAEQAAERQHRIVGLAGDLVDHEIFDPAELLARAAVVDGGAFYPVRGDQPAR